jgi:hypothetical protein
VEALRHGQTVIASDLAIHREVGGTACDYFPLSEPERLVAAIQSHEARSGSRAAACRAGILPQTWADAVARLLDGLRGRLGETERSGNAASQPSLRMVA